MPKPNGWIGENWQGRKPGPYKWYEIQDTVAYSEEFKKQKIIIPAIVQRASYAFDKNGFYSNDKTSIIPTTDLYLLGVLNSKVPDFVMHTISSTKQGGYYEYKPMYIEQLPIRTINPSDPTDKAMHDEMVALVERMLRLHEEKGQAGARPVGELETDIRATDAAIDALVYRLYGLTDEEIKIVEGTAV